MTPVVVRFSDLLPTKKSFDEESVGLPGEAYASIAAESVYSLVAPEGNKRGAARPAITGPDGLEVVVAVCPPGQGPALHAHTRTTETFVCISGRYEIIWGDEGEHSVVLDQADTVSVPPGVFRRFRNVSDVEDAKLLVLVQGSVRDTFNDVMFDPNLVPALTARWGESAIDNFANIGITFGRPQRWER